MKRIRLAIVFGLICAIMLSLARFDVLCDDLRHNVFRLHILANSDSKEDQELKLMVRDAVLKISRDMFVNCENSQQAEQTAKNNLDVLKKEALKVIKENNFDYEVEITVGPAYFENRDYEDFTLPAGEYNALNIKIGEAKGKNWWCVMFPSVCIGASSKLSDAVNNESANIAERSNDYKIRFKTVEIYESIKKLLKF